MDIIVTAKDRQAAEANKNATSLLLEIDKERQVEEHRRLQAAKRRERRKAKKREKLKEKDKEYVVGVFLVSNLHFVKKFATIIIFSHNLFCSVI